MCLSPRDSLQSLMCFSSGSKVQQNRQSKVAGVVEERWHSLHIPTPPQYLASSKQTLHNCTQLVHRSHANSPTSSWDQLEITSAPLYILSTIPFPSMPHQAAMEMFQWVYLRWRFSVKSVTTNTHQVVYTKVDQRSSFSLRYKGTLTLCSEIAISITRNTHLWNWDTPL